MQPGWVNRSILPTSLATSYQRTFWQQLLPSLFQNHPFVCAQPMDQRRKISAQPLAHEFCDILKFLPTPQGTNLIPRNFLRKQLLLSESLQLLAEALAQGSVPSKVPHRWKCGLPRSRARCGDEIRRCCECLLLWSWETHRISNGFSILMKKNKQNQQKKHKPHIP